MLKGKGISKGIGFGKVIILEDENIEVGPFKIENVENEMEIFNKAYDMVIDETKHIVDNLNGTEKDIMEAYLMILQDPSLIEESLKLIKEEKYNAGYAVEQGFNTIISTFEKMEDSYMAERASDIADMKKRILAKIVNKKITNLSEIPENTIIVAKELTTSNTAKLKLKNVSGIITELGGMTSHVAIMARTHEIPLIIGVNYINGNFKNGDNIAIDGEKGEIFVNPNEEKVDELKDLQNKEKIEKEDLDKYKGKESVTLDNHKVELVANIGTPKDIDIVLQNDAEGIGLFRSEFLYMDSKNMPSEEEQFIAYKEVAEKMQDKIAIVRTLDIGGDKDLKYMKLPEETNPFLGYRAIRICLDQVDLFKVQLRAILRASAFGNLAIMLPMISSIEELRKSKSIIDEVKDELNSFNIPYNEKIKIGIMIEIPSAAILADSLAKECDFFSIGTNDLTQYTVAVERGNEKVAHLYNKYNPAVIRLIKNAIDGAHQNGIMCGMCGEAAGDEKFIPLLIGLGLDEFSMNPNKILKARKIISNLNYTECKKISEEVLKCDTAEEVEKNL